ncbi:hypothetical protein [Clostridium tertium]|uniref:hypothetical protein n=1 Tax=Clostridium tertium TaxID=1559 RepID=UPI001AE7A91A|nr:hypothetical protein [Clostridium tertium]MBP1869863.1 hypothetical protein [Clostridium tertium]
MFITVLNTIGLVFYWTWFIWPFTFIYSLVNAFKNVINKECPTLNIVISSISLLVIIAGIQLAAQG